DPPHSESVATVKVLETPAELGPVPLRPGGPVNEHPHRASRGERVDLQVRVLLDGRNPRVSDGLPHRLASMPENVRTRRFWSTGYRSGLWSGAAPRDRRNHGL